MGDGGQDAEGKDGRQEAEDVRQKARDGDGRRDKRQGAEIG
jgi:hypothetical protein